jgi:hypothetical protein
MPVLLVAGVLALPLPLFALLDVLASDTLFLVPLPRLAAWPLSGTCALVFLPLPLPLKFPLEDAVVILTLASGIESLAPWTNELS